ncbi:MAG TPA: hypothetical protein VMS56_02330 [Thermoanaerobaculia bacterium]|nr:hypothetical protein [Thermoanaerobaculia bacterium]
MRSRRAALTVLVLALALAPFPLEAQAPHADWRTLDTPRFRVHYPAAWEGWARHAASRLEQVRDRVEAEVGWTIEEKVDVLVMDPFAVANGSAWPMLGWPRIVLWTNPPPPESVIGANRDWIEILTVHETAHLAHLLRPSRDPVRRFLASAVPLGPIASAPRWVTEGYATVIEGDLTGTGRPNSDFRAAVLRQWAREGRLPTYGQLAGDRTNWMGMSMAYLVGSAYLEWLREREGPDSLPSLWARMTARSHRSFDAAFHGVFGDSPADLYRRFTAEVTARAIGLEQLLAPSLREGDLWQDLSWSTEAPDVSPDGSSLVTVIRARDEPSRVVVFDTDPDTDAEKRYTERIGRMLERDPDDVAPVRRTPLPRKPLFERVTRDGAEPFTPRWMPDGESILFVRFEPDPDGYFHPDLFLWELESDTVTRLTRLADLRDPDPSPNGRTAVAVRNRHGFSELVEVDLNTGAVESIGAPSVAEIWSSPRWSPDGSHLAYVRHERGSWRLFVREGARGGEREVPLEEGAVVAQPSWGEDSTTLYAAVGRAGFIEIHRFDPSTGAVRQITRSLGASFAPAPVPDGSGLYYLSIDAEGLDLRHLALDEPLPPMPPLLPVEIDPAAYFPLVRPLPDSSIAELEPVELGRSRPYGLGRAETRLHTAGRWMPSNRSLEAGLRAGDLIGRWNALAMASFGEEEGGSLAAVWRGWPVWLRTQLFRGEQQLSDQPGCEAGVFACETDALDLEREGVELAMSWRRLGRTLRFEADGGVVLQRIDGASGEASQRIAFVAIEPALRRRFGKLGLGLTLDGRGELGETEGERWSRTRLGLGGELAWSDTSLAVALERGTGEDLAAPFDRFALGGIVGSIFPRAALSTRIEAPSLPAGTAIGDEHEGQKASFAFGGPLRWFYERHRLWSGLGPRGEWIELAGLEASADLDPVPLVRVPGLELRVGVARILSAPLEGDTTWWISTAWRP